MNCHHNNSPSGQTVSGRPFKFSVVIKYITIKCFTNRNGSNQLFEPKSQNIYYSLIDFRKYKFSHYSTTPEDRSNSWEEKFFTK